MQKPNCFSNFFVAICLVLGTLAGIPLQSVQASSLDTQDAGISPESYLKEDGSLNLNGTFTGSLDLSGWDVQLDLQ
jgi:hypothetical protein